MEQLKVLKRKRWLVAKFLEFYLLKFGGKLLMNNTLPRSQYKVIEILSIYEDEFYIFTLEFDKNQTLIMFGFNYSKKNPKNERFRTLRRPRSADEIIELYQEHDNLEKYYNSIFPFFGYYSAYNEDKNCDRCELIRQTLFSKRFLRFFMKQAENDDDFRRVIYSNLDLFEV